MTTNIKLLRCSEYFYPITIIMKSREQVQQIKLPKTTTWKENINWNEWTSNDKVLDDLIGRFNGILDEILRCDNNRIKWNAEWSFKSLLENANIKKRLSNLINWQNLNSDQQKVLLELAEDKLSWLKYKWLAMNTIIPVILKVKTIFNWERKFWN